MSAHTPGPWSLIETPHEKIISCWHIQVGERQILVHPYKRIWSEDRTQSGFVIDCQHMADARLIAAAPELLDAMKLLVAEYEPNMKAFALDAPRKAKWAAACAAIAKATGVTE